MSSTTQPTDLSDLIADLQQRLQITEGVTTDENIAKRYINTALQDMHIGYQENFHWSEREAVLVTQAEYTTGTVAISKGDTTLTGTDTFWDTNNDFSVKNARVGGKIVINGGVEIYTVSAVGGDTDITLTSDFIQTTVTTASYSYFEDEYALDSDFLRPVDATFFDTNRSIQIIGKTEFRNRFPRNKITGKPLIAAIVDKSFSGSTTPVRKVRFHRPPDTNYMIPYRFITNKLAVSSGGTEQVSLSADSDEPIVPLQFRHAIVLHALYNWYRDRKDDTRSLEVKGEYVDLIIRITSDVEIGRSRPQIRPNVSSYAIRAHTPYRGRGQHFTLGTAFDELRDRR